MPRRGRVPGRLQRADPDGHDTAVEGVVDEFPFSIDEIAHDIGGAATFTGKNVTLNAGSITDTGVRTITATTLALNAAGQVGTDATDGIDVAAQPQQALARMGVLSDARGLYTRLTARENIVYYGRLHGLSADAADARMGDWANAALVALQTSWY